MRIVSLASGSKGNATYVEEGESAILIDCGLAFRELKRRAASAAIDLGRIQALLITHSHTDHTSGITTFRKHFPAVELYANMMTSEAVMADVGLEEADFITFENGQSFSVGDFEVTPFSIPHDTADPVGYLLKGVETYFHATDVGSPLDSIGVKLAEADFATLESNHDLQLLYGSGRPPPLIQRISGPRGHLSNDQAAELVSRFASPRLKKLGLAHLSHDCNVPHFAEKVMRTELDRVNLKDIEIKVYSQNEVVEL